MLNIQSYLHRQTISDIIARCLTDQRNPGDLQTLKTYINLNSYCAVLWSDRLVRRLFEHIFGNVTSMVATNKGVLKKMAIESPWYVSPRIDDMITRFKKYPQDFYLETPFEGKLWFTHREITRFYIGAARMKRFRRIAEKGARRIIDYLHLRVKAAANDLATERAKELGIPKARLITPVDQQVAEFCHAERRVLKAIRLGTIRDEFPELSIPDVVGVKVIAENEGLRRLMDFIDASDDLEIHDEEDHYGKYNAKNLQLIYRVPKDLLLANPPSGPVLDLFRARGFCIQGLTAAYRQFVASAEHHVMFEVIVSDYQAMLESEIGRSMHEEHVLSQRASEYYQSNLGRNVFYMMDHLLNVCLSDVNHLDQMPIKLWVKYMPDYIEDLHRKLHFNPKLTFTNIMAQPHPVPALRPRLVGASLPDRLAT